MLVQEPTQAAIWHCLNYHAYSDAIFLAERLEAEVDNDEALYILATTYYRSGNVSRAHSVLTKKGQSQNPQVKYLTAKCCFDLGKFNDAEFYLTGCHILRSKQIDELVSEFGSFACFALQLLGLIFAKTDRIKKAKDCLKISLKLNPFLWHSFASLCDFGDAPDSSSIFKLDNIENFSNVHGNTVYSIFSNTDNKLNTKNESNNKISNFIVTPKNFMNENNQTPLLNSKNNQLNAPMNNAKNIQPVHHVSTPVQNSLITPLSGIAPMDTVDSFDVLRTKKMVRFQRFLGSNSSFSPITPSFGVFPLDLTANSNEIETSVHSSVALLTPSPLSIDYQNQQNIGKQVMCRNLNKDTSLVMNKPTVFAPTANNNNVQSMPSGQGYVRRSSRLFGNSSSVKENNKNRFVAPNPKSPARKSKSRSCKNQNSLNELNEKNKSENIDLITSTEKSLADKPEKPINHVNIPLQALNIQKMCSEGLMNLLKDIGAAYVEVSAYNCKKAIELFGNLSTQQFYTPWVLSLVAKAYFEINDYFQAEKYFNEARQLDPKSFYMMEYYSSTLWHLQKEVQLSAFAHDLIETDRESAQAWCAAGNCFSLQKEHESAIKFLSRAIQVNPNFTYAYTLLGHEYLATEELDRALDCYRNAVKLDPRHYNAWYGVGLVSYKQERFAQAEIYYKKAAKIHPQCSILLCHIAVVEHTLHKSTAALETLTKALEIEPRNALCKYQRASILHALDRHAEALEELLELKQIVPKESNVYFLLGKVYKKMGKIQLALMNFSWAMDLDPKDSNSQFKEALDPAVNGPNTDNDNALNGSIDNAPAIVGDEMQIEATPSFSLNPVPFSNSSLDLLHSDSFSVPSTSNNLNTGTSGLLSNGQSGTSGLMSSGQIGGPSNAFSVISSVSNLTPDNGGSASFIMSNATAVRNARFIVSSRASPTMLSSLSTSAMSGLSTPGISGLSTPAGTSTNSSSRISLSAVSIPSISIPSNSAVNIVANPSSPPLYTSLSNITPRNEQLPAFSGQIQAGNSCLTGLRNQTTAINSSLAGNRVHSPILGIGSRATVRFLDSPDLESNEVLDNNRPITPDNQEEEL